jgi:phytoene synthase
MQHTQAITQRSGSNLALGFRLLPRAKREGMAALYAFCREVDDVADEESAPVETRRQSLREWREDVRRACGGEKSHFPVNQELQPVIRQYGLPFEYFDALITGVEMDLDVKRYQTYEELEVYCYRVASVVGLLSIEIFGYKDPRCKEYAIQLGKALQFTNILRDVGSDAERGRIYLPQTELKRFNVQAEDILQHKYTPEFVQLAESFAARGKQFYAAARASLAPADRKSMIAAELMALVYWNLLRKLERIRFQVMDPKPTRLNKGQKLFLIAKAWARLALGTGSPAYGTA